MSSSARDLERQGFDSQPGLNGGGGRSKTTQNQTQTARNRKETAPSERAVTEGRDAGEKEAELELVVKSADAKKRKVGGSFRIDQVG